MIVFDSTVNKAAILFSQHMIRFKHIFSAKDYSFEKIDGEKGLLISQSHSENINNYNGKCTRKIKVISSKIILISKILYYINININFYMCRRYHKVYIKCCMLIGCTSVYIDKEISHRTPFTAILGHFCLNFR